MKIFFIAIFALSTVCCTQANPPLNITSLCDCDPSTVHIMDAEGDLSLLFNGFEAPMKSYQLYSSGERAEFDPVGWVLSGSHDGRRWVELDRCEGYTFCSRYQELDLSIHSPSNYSWYKIDILPSPNQPYIGLGDVRFSESNSEALWSNFVYPKVDFKVLDPQSEGASIYASLVQQPDEYIRYHARKVAEILFFSACDSMNVVGQIDYTLKDYKGVSAKSGVPAHTGIVYSTQHIENSARESLFKLDFETRGVLFHELVHAYQFEPKSIGTYSTNKEFWACIEGMADAVRTQAGLFDVASLRKPGGTWLDGYKTTGFFLQWLTTKRPDAIREFHITVRDLDPWSFDGAMKQLFGPDSGIEEMWAEYQQFLLHNGSQSDVVL